MLKKMTSSAIGALVGAIVIVLLVAVLVSMVRWGQANPDQLAALADKVAKTLVAIVVWVCDGIQAALS
jgi:hypothetical protein